MAGVRQFVAFEGAPRAGWPDNEAAIASAEPDFTQPEISERDLLTINYTSGTTARPKGVMITHRNAARERDRHPPKTATGKIQKFVLRGGAANIARQ